MKTFIFQRAKKISEHKKILESKLKIKIKFNGRQVTIEGDEELEEFLAYNVLESINLGFDIDTALLLIEPDFVFEKIEIKNLTKRANLVLVRARIIGKDGRTKAIIEELSDCHISLYENTVGVIGHSDKIKTCMQAVTRLIQGSKQGNVYLYLEKQRKIYHPEDLGLKINVSE
jgi:ribosomal RNA assembly protein